MFSLPIHKLMDAIQNLSQGRGKASLDDDLKPLPAAIVPVDSNVATCTICFEPCHLTHNPFQASLTAASSGRIAFGRYIGERGDGHSYCISCLATYITTKLEDLVLPKSSPSAVLRYALCS